MRRLAITSWLLLASGCSLLGFDDFAIYQCGSDAECEPLNERDGIAPGDCYRWQCPGDNHTSGCALRARDDDDDGVAACGDGPFDCDDRNPAVSTAAPFSFVPFASVDASDRWVRWVSDEGRVGATFGAAREARVALATPSREGATITALTDASVNDLAIAAGCARATLTTPPLPTTPVVGAGPGTCSTHEECQDGTFCNGYETCEPTSPAADGRGCRAAMRAQCLDDGETCEEPAGACARVSAGTCQLAEVAAASAGGGAWIGVGVNVSGCDEGQLRFGWMSPSGDASLADGVPGAGLLTRGDARRAPGFTGVDLGAGAAGACSGGGRADGSSGISAPSIASLPGGASAGRFRPQALAAWQAARRSRESSGATDAVGVEAIGLWLEEAPAAGGDPLRWVSATGSGRPVALTPRAQGAAPVAIAGDPVLGGYAVAYAAEGGGVSLRVVPAPRDPSEVSATSPHASTIDPLGAARATPDLDVPAGVILDPGTSLDHVVVAADGSDIAVAWVAAGQACFRAVTSGGLEGGATRCAGAGVTSVAVARADTGWLLLYVDAAGVQLAAVDASGTPGSPEMVSVGSGLGDPFVASAGRSVQVGFRRGDELLAGGRCGP